MSSGTRLTKSAVWVDTGRSISDKSVGVALIYDPDKQCYYETSIAGIVRYVREDMEAKFAAKSSELDAKEAEIDAKIKALEEKQSQFIADITKANASVIDLVEKTITEGN